MRARLAALAFACALAPAAATPREDRINRVGALIYKGAAPSGLGLVHAAGQA